jgi:hypothetical protein
MLFPVGPESFHHLLGTRQGSWRGRARRCLLKGCERWFRPKRPQSRYCSEECSGAARRWRRVKASRRYRASAHGRERRREQHRRYRQGRRQRQASADVRAAREGKRPACAHENFAERVCDRPGCYVVFSVRHEHSCRRFCSVVCRLALRRVLDREEHYRARRRRWRRERLTRPCPHPDTS